MRLRGSIRNQGVIDWPKIVFISLVVTVIVVLSIGSMVSLAAFNPYNPTWEGTSDFRTMVTDAEEPGIIHNADRYDDLSGSETVFVFAPTEDYDATDAARIAAFLDRGGTLVLLDNFGESGNTLLADLGLDTRFSGDVLQDEQHYDRSPTMPIATGVRNHSLTGGVESVTLNYATALTGIANESVVITSSRVTYLGPDDADIDDDAELTAYPIVGVESVGDGEVITVGDPSIAVNEMLHRTDNRQFMANLATTGDEVIIDVSHGSPIPPLRFGVLAFRSIPILTVLVGLIGIIGISLLGERRLPRPRIPAGVRSRLPPWLLPPRRVPALDDETRRQLLAQEYPDWDPERRERVLAALNHLSDEDQDDNRP